MDQERFDELARTLAATRSRRTMLGGLVAGAFGAGVARVADAAAKRNRKPNRKNGAKRGKGGSGGRVSAQAVGCEPPCPQGEACIEDEGTLTCVACDPECDPGEACVDAEGEATCVACEPECVLGQECQNVGDEPTCVCVGEPSCPACCPGGCCDGEGTCQPSTDATCGIGGVACVECELGQNCVAGTCSCNADSCSNGCCTAVEGGTCLEGTADDACGSGGVICTDCGPGVDCVNKVCTTCGAGACPDGCCDDGVCRPGTNPNNCGANGEACVECPPGQNCIASGEDRICAFAVCDATTCPDGCCDGDVCRPGTSVSNCGAGGVACIACESGQICEDGICVCNATSCPSGCCDANGTCREGDTVQACGDGGVACVTCTGSNPVCVTGSCQTDPPCPQTYELCNGFCVQLSTNKSNCGVCDNSCPPCGKRSRPICEGGACGCTQKKKRRRRRQRKKK